MKTALTFVAVLAMLVAARAKPLECVLWPKTCQVPAAAPAPTPAPVPAPRAAPVAPKVDTGRPMPSGPAVVKAKPKPKPITRVKAKAKPKAAKPKRVIKPKAQPARGKAAVDDGPDLPWPCWMARVQASGKSCAQLAAEGASRGLKLSPKQERQGLACLGKLGKGGQCVDAKRVQP